MSQEGSIEQLLELCKEVACYPPGEIQANLEDGSTESVEFEYPLPIV